MARERQENSRVNEAPATEVAELTRENDVSAGTTIWPRITLVTAVLNSAKYIEQTIRSVIYQRYPNLEYIIVDGGSIDGTVEIIKRYEEHLAWWTSERDNGHFDALNKGFARSSGEIMGWINGSDQLHVGALFSVGNVFRTLSQVEWITGLPTWFDEQGTLVKVGPLPRWSRLRYLAGANRYIQQESTFWRRSLWERAGGYVDASRKIGSDFELWVRFFRCARLFPVNTLIGGYRSHPDAASSRQLDEIHRLNDEAIEAELATMRAGCLLKAFRRWSARAQRTRKVRVLWWHLATRPLYFLAGPDWPPVIQYDMNAKRWTITG